MLRLAVLARLCFVASVVLCWLGCAVLARPGHHERAADDLVTPIGARRPRPQSHRVSTSPRARRFAIYDADSRLFSYYANEVDGKLKREQRGAVTVTTTIFYDDRFAFYTESGRFYECFSDPADDLKIWKTALPQPTGAKAEGWVWKHKRGAKSGKFQKRYATFEAETAVFSYYTDDTRGVPKGRATIACAVRRTTPCIS